MRFPTWLFVLGSVLPAFSETMPVDLEKHIAEFEAHHSLNYADQYYATVYQGEKTISGFASFHVNPNNKADSGRYLGFESHWLLLNGKKFLPQNTDSISLNGIPGKPVVGFWLFAVERGIITAYSIEPYGELVKAEMEGQVYPLEKSRDQKRFRELLKKIPEAYLQWHKEPLGAICYYNRFQHEAVTDLNYEETEEENSLPGKTLIRPRENAERVDKNPNDLVALGRLAEYFCMHKEFDKAAGYLERMDRVKSPHFRTLLVRGFCEDEKLNRTVANVYYDSATRHVPYSLQATLQKTMVRNDSVVVYDTVRTVNANKQFFMGYKFGFGIPFSAVGMGLYTQFQFSGFRFSASASEGILNVVWATPIPALSLRLYAPGQVFRAYIGFVDFNFYSTSRSSALRLIGPEIGGVFDLKRPGGFLFEFGASYYFEPSHLSVDGKETIGASKDIFPYLGVGYEF